MVKEAIDKSIKSGQVAFPNAEEMESKDQPTKEKPEKDENEIVSEEVKEEKLGGEDKKDSSILSGGKSRIDKNESRIDKDESRIDGKSEMKPEAKIESKAKEKVPEKKEDAKSKDKEKGHKEGQKHKRDKGRAKINDLPESANCLMIHKALTSGASINQGKLLNTQKKVTKMLEKVTNIFKVFAEMGRRRTLILKSFVINMIIRLENAPFKQKKKFHLLQSQSKSFLKNKK